MTNPTPTTPNPPPPQGREIYPEPQVEGAQEEEGARDPVQRGQEQVEPPSGPEPRPGAGFEGDPTAWPPDEVLEAVDLDDRGWTRRNLEAILLVADEPVPASVLAEIVGSRLSEVEEMLVDLAGEYARDGRGFVLRAIAGGWRLYTHPAREPPWRRSSRPDSTAASPVRPSRRWQ